MSAETLTLEPPEENNEHICADLAKLLGYRLRDCHEANDELHMWSLYDENKNHVNELICFFPVSNTVQLTGQEGNVLKTYKLNITLTEL